MKNKITSIVLLYSIIFFSSCATIISGHKQFVSFSSQPSDAKIIVDGKIIGVTPLTAKIKRRSHSLVLQKEGYQSSEYIFNSKFNGWFVGNLLLGGLGGMIIDLINGSYTNIDDNIYRELQKKEVNF